MLTSNFPDAIQTKYGLSVYRDDPKAEAYRQMTALRANFHVEPTGWAHEDGSVTVYASDMQSVTFIPTHSL